MNTQDRQQSTERSPGPSPLSPWHSSPRGSGDDGIDLFELLRGLVDHKRLVVIITGVVTALAAIVAWSITPMYRAEVLLAPVRSDKAGVSAALAGQFGDLAELAGVNLGETGTSTAKAVATLKSRALTDAFIEEEHVLPILFARKWDAGKGKWKVDDEDDIPTLWKAYELFNKKIRSVTENKKTGLVRLEIEWKTPSLAAEWATELVKRVNEQLRNDAIREAEKSIAYLKQELKRTDVVEVAQAMYRLIEAQTKNIMVANAREEYAFQVIDPAVPPEKKSKPKRTLIIALGFMLGLTVAVFTVFVRTTIAKQENRRRAAGQMMETEVAIQDGRLDSRDGAAEAPIASRAGVP